MIREQLASIDSFLFDTHVPSLTLDLLIHSKVSYVQRLKQTVKTQYRRPAPRRTDRPDQADRLLKYLTPSEKRIRTMTIQKILNDPALNL